MATSAPTCASQLSGVAAGVFRDAQEAVEACVRVRDEIEPDDGWTTRYAEGYERFQALYPALREAR